VAEGQDILEINAPESALGTGQLGDEAKKLEEAKNEGAAACVEVNGKLIAR
jgi:hypothetical protein